MPIPTASLHFFRTIITNYHVIIAGRQDMKIAESEVRKGGEGVLIRVRALIKAWVLIRGDKVINYALSSSLSIGHQRFPFFTSSCPGLTFRVWSSCGSKRHSTWTSCHQVFFWVSSFLFVQGIPIQGLPGNNSWMFLHGVASPSPLLSTDSVVSEWVPD